MKVFILMLASGDEGYEDPHSLHLSLDDAKKVAAKADIEGPLRWVKAADGSCEFADDARLAIRAYVFERDLDITLCNFCLCRWEHGEDCQCQNDE